MNGFLPMTREELRARGWEQVDFLFVFGDAYVDHPSFGPAIISRILEREGYRVGMIAQPDWRSPADFTRLGAPRLGILVSAGNLDSLLGAFTAAKKRRRGDLYSPGGKAGLRPDRATIVYCNRLREAFKDTPLIIGGIEASLRRFAHYDYWSDTVRRSILIDSRADLLVYGMGETQMREIAAQLAAGRHVSDIRAVRGVCWKTKNPDDAGACLTVPDYEAVRADKRCFAAAFKTQYEEQDPIRGQTLRQKHGGEYVVQNPPALPLTTKQLDDIYALPYRRTYHPVYEQDGGVPAIEEVRFSLVSQRGCFGGCSFCAIGAHQGRMIQSRSHESLVAEAAAMTRQPGFKGYIHDVGGPTANFRRAACAAQLTRGACRDKACLAPAPCRRLTADHADYLALLRKIRALPGVKKVFIRSGLRYDYLMLDRNWEEFLRELCAHHVSGQLKIAPEHVAIKVTRLMGKAPRDVYDQFVRAYRKMNEELGKKQYLVPYLMSSHPGATLREAVELAEFVRDLRYNPEQVQDFIPTPGSLSTCMYYTGLNPLTGEAVYVARDPHDKRLQRALLQYRDPQNYALVREALLKAGRADLIGPGPRCLIRSRPPFSRPGPRGAASSGPGRAGPASRRRG